MPTDTDQVLAEILRLGLHIRVDCRSCRHWGSLSPLGLVKRIGLDQSLGALRRRLRCSRCGGRRVEVRTIGPARR